MSALDKGLQRRDQFQIALRCTCGQTGTAIWEENTGYTFTGPQSELISLSDGFYERIAKKSPYPIEVVCHTCGAVLPT